MNKVTVIAEIGINHKGNMAMAKMLIASAHISGADIVKFQFYRPEEILGKDNPYLLEAKTCQFTENQHKELKNYCDARSIEWLLSIFHADQVPFCESIGMKRYKIASRAALDDQLLYAVAATGKPVILSTGLCNNERLDLISKIFPPPYPLTLLYCICDYPTRPDRINLEKMTLLRNHAPSIGFSSHCPQIAPTLAAVARGAKVVENHIAMTRLQEGCDISSSLNIDEFDQMVGLIRDMEAIV